MKNLLDLKIYFLSHHFRNEHKENQYYLFFWIPAGPEMFCKFAPPETISVRDFNFVSETDWRGEECDQSCISGPV